MGSTVNGPTNGHGANGSGERSGGGGGRGRGPHKATIPPWMSELPPHNLEAEQGVLGSILLDNEILHEVIPIVRFDDFYRDAHQIIFRAIVNLYDRGHGIDAITLSEELTQRGEFERAGGDDTIAEILNSVPHAANGKYHAEIVRQKSIIRQLILGSAEIIQDGYSANFSADDLLQLAERKIYSISEGNTTANTIELREILGVALDRISARAESNQPITGLSTRFPDLDHLTCGFQPGQLIILAARPSMGKTALALNFCEHAITEHEPARPVMFVSLEMGRVELAERLLCSRAKVDGHKLRTGQKLMHPEMTVLGNVLDQMRQTPMFIDDSPTRTMLQITANARRLKMRNDIGLIVVDYIQLIEPEASEARESRQEQIAKISRRLKTLSKEIEVPVIALSQLNRAVESREDRRPRMADLRESGAIEQDADVVLLLHRPEYYDPNDQPGIAEAIIAKNRNGATGSVKLAFLKNFMRFESLSTHEVPIDAGTF